MAGDIGGAEVNDVPKDGAGGERTPRYDPLMKPPFRYGSSGMRAAQGLPPADLSRRIEDAADFVPIPLPPELPGGYDMVYVRHMREVPGQLQVNPEEIPTGLLATNRGDRVCLWEQGLPEESVGAIFPEDPRFFTEGAVTLGWTENGAVAEDLEQAVFTVDPVDLARVAANGRVYPGTNTCWAALRGANGAVGVFSFDRQLREKIRERYPVLKSRTPLPLIQAT